MIPIRLDWDWLKARIGIPAEARLELEDHADVPSAVATKKALILYVTDDSLIAIEKVHGTRTRIGPPVFHERDLEQPDEQEEGV